MIPDGKHHPHKYMDERGYVFSCCGEHHTFHSRKGRDKFAIEHEDTVSKEREQDRR